MSQNSRPLLFFVLVATVLTVACGSPADESLPIDRATETATEDPPTVEPDTVIPNPTLEMTAVRSSPTPDLATQNPTPEMTVVQSSPTPDLVSQESDPAKLISADTVKEIQQLFTLTGYAVAFPSEATYITTGGLDGSVKIWNLFDGTLDRELVRLDGMIFELAYSPDNRLLAGTVGDSVIVLDAANGETIARFQGLGRHVQAVAFSPDQARLAAGGSDIVGLWNTSSWEEVARLDGHEGNIFDLAISPDGTRLLSSGGIPDSTVVIWDLESIEILHTLTGHGGDIHRLALAPDGQTVVSGGTDRHLKSWQVADGQQGMSLRGFRDVIYGLAYSPSGDLVAAACGSDSFIMFWDPESGDMIGTLDDPRGEMLNVNFSPNAEYLASSNNLGEVIVWGVR